MSEVKNEGFEVEVLMRLLEDRYPDSEERVTVEVFADWLRDNVSALQASSGNGGGTQQASMPKRVAGRQNWA